MPQGYSPSVSDLFLLVSWLPPSVSAPLCASTQSTVRAYSISSRLTAVNRQYCSIIRASVLSTVIVCSVIRASLLSTVNAAPLCTPQCLSAPYFVQQCCPLVSFCSIIHARLLSIVSWKRGKLTSYYLTVRRAMVSLFLSSKIITLFFGGTLSAFPLNTSQPPHVNDQ